MTDDFLGHPLLWPVDLSWHFLGERWDPHADLAEREWARWWVFNIYQFFGTEHYATAISGLSLRMSRAPAEALWALTSDPPEGLNIGATPSNQYLCGCQYMAVPPVCTKCGTLTESGPASS